MLFITILETWTFRLRRGSTSSLFNIFRITNKTKVKMDSKDIQNEDGKEDAKVDLQNILKSYLGIAKDQSAEMKDLNK